VIWICNGLLICDAFPVLAAGGQERAVVRFLIREEQSGLLGKMKSMGLATYGAMLGASYGHALESSATPAALRSGCEG
jgi:hypothetical protein